MKVIDDLTLMEKLDLAEAMLESILPMWNLDKETCEACGYDHVITWEDFMCHQSTGAAINRIQRIRRELQKPKEQMVATRIANGMTRHQHSIKMDGGKGTFNKKGNLIK